MKIIFNQEKTDRLAALTFKYNFEVKKRWKILSLILSVISGLCTIILSRITDKTILSLILSVTVVGFLIPAFFRDFVPLFKFLPDQASFFYAAICFKSKTANVEVKDIKKKNCTLIISSNVDNGESIRREYEMPVVRKEEVEEIIVDFERNTVYLPIALENTKE